MPEAGFLPCGETARLKNSVVVVPGHSAIALTDEPRNSTLSATVQWSTNAFVAA